jgi:hypothetical protein
MALAFIGGILALIRYAQGSAPVDALTAGVLLGVAAAALFFTSNVLSTYLRINKLYQNKTLTRVFPWIFTWIKPASTPFSDLAKRRCSGRMCCSSAKRKPRFTCFMKRRRANVMPKGQLSQEDAKELRSALALYYKKSRASQTPPEKK